jgi:hypothetical protein
MKQNKVDMEGMPSFIEHFFGGGVVRITDFWMKHSSSLAKQYALPSWGRCLIYTDFSKLKRTPHCASQGIWEDGVSRWLVPSRVPISLGASCSHLSEGRKCEMWRLFPTSSNSSYFLGPLHWSIVCFVSDTVSWFLPPTPILWKQELPSAKRRGSAIDNRGRLWNLQSSWPDTLQAGCAWRQEAGPDDSVRKSQFLLCLSPNLILLLAWQTHWQTCLQEWLIANFWCCGD